MSNGRRPSFRHFRDLSTADLQCDLHVHTRRTDGEEEIETILRAASERGLRRIAFTEHVRRDSSWFHDFAREVRDRSRAHPHLEVLVGCETKALDPSGAIDASEAILDECDIVLGSVHRFPDPAGGFVDTARYGPEELARSECELAMGLLRSGHIDVLAHPGGMYARRHGRDLPGDLLRPLVATAIERGVAVEINSSYARDLEGLLSLLDELDPLVSIASDVHRLRDLGRCRDLLAACDRFRLAPRGRERVAER